MVKKKNLVTILIVVAIVLGIRFLVTYSDDFKHVVVGLYMGQEPATNCYDDCSDGTSPGECSHNIPFYCLAQAPTVEECGLVQDCSECGCWPPDYVCNSEKGTCSPFASPGDDDEEEYCDSHWECTCNELCVNDDGDLLNFDEDPSGSCSELGDDCGECVVSDEEDGFCASEYLEVYGFDLCIGGDWETCLMDVADCGGKEEWEGGCPVETECLPMEDDPNYGECSFLYAEDLCTDGTPFGECSDLDAGGYGPPMYCNPDTGLIIPMCAGADEIMYNEDDCGCPEPDGDIVYVCTEPDPDMGLINWECEGTNYEVGQKPLLCGNGYCDEDSEEPWFAENCENCPEDCCPTGPADDDDDDGPYSAGEVNYCTQVGGVCAESCDSDYYILEDTEDYSDLHEACRDKDEDYVCCYPYANDELNDCEYYGGECKEECSGDYYHSEVPYLDDECLFYSDSESLCCLKYEDTSGNEGDSESGEEDASLWENLFGSPETNEDDPNYDEAAYIHLGENISLHRNYVFVGVIIIIVLAFAITVYYPKFKKK